MYRRIAEDFDVREDSEVYMVLMLTAVLHMLIVIKMCSTKHKVQAKYHNIQKNISCVNIEFVNIT